MPVSEHLDQPFNCILLVGGIYKRQIYMKRRLMLLYSRLRDVSIWTTRALGLHDNYNSYINISHGTFKNMFEKGEFVCSLDSGGERYGITHTSIYNAINGHNICIINVDFEGAKKIISLPYVSAKCILVENFPNINDSKRYASIYRPSIDLFFGVISSSDPENSVIELVNMINPLRIGSVRQNVHL